MDEFETAQPSRVSRKRYPTLGQTAAVASPVASPERLMRAEEDITAISDTVLDIRATVNAHTDTLSTHGRELAGIRGALATITSTLDEILTAIRPAK